MNTINIELPNNVDKIQIVNGINLLISNLDLFEDFLLGLKMNEIPDKDLFYPIDNLKRKYENLL